MADLPGLDCGLCGFRLCSEFAVRLKENPDLIERCIHLTDSVMPGRQHRTECGAGAGVCGACGDTAADAVSVATVGPSTWKDSLDREFDFYLEHFPEEPGPREIILPRNPLLCRELELQPGDILIGRPLGMSCGCPITHCGVTMEADHRTGVVVWCVTGPLVPRESGFKDLFLQLFSFLLVDLDFWICSFCFLFWLPYVIPKLFLIARLLCSSKSV